MDGFEARVHDNKTRCDDTHIHFHYSDCQRGNVRPWYTSVFGLNGAEGKKLTLWVGLGRSIWVYHQY